MYSSKNNNLPIMGESVGFMNMLQKKLKAKKDEDKHNEVAVSVREIQAKPSSKQSSFQEKEVKMLTQVIEFKDKRIYKNKMIEKFEQLKKTIQNIKQQNLKLKEEVQELMSGRFRNQSQNIWNDITEIIFLNLNKLQLVYQNRIEKIKVVNSEEMCGIEEKWKSKMNEIYKQTYSLTQPNPYESSFIMNRDRFMANEIEQHKSSGNIAEILERSRQKQEEIEMRKQYEEKLEKYEAKIAKLTSQLSKFQQNISNESKEEQNNYKYCTLIEQIRQKDKLVEGMKEGYDLVVKELQSIKKKQKEFDQEINVKNVKIFDMYSALNLKNKEIQALKQCKLGFSSCKSQENAQSYRTMRSCKRSDSNNMLIEDKYGKENFNSINVKPQLNQKEVKSLMELLDQVKNRSKSKHTISSKSNYNNLKIECDQFVPQNQNSSFDSGKYSRSNHYRTHYTN